MSRKDSKIKEGFDSDFSGDNPILWVNLQIIDHRYCALYVYTYIYIYMYVRMYVCMYCM